MFKYDVSIIIAIYNSEKYLKECIESVLKQKYQQDKIQIILINDGSTDNSLEICNKYAEKNKNILVINQENKGVSGARNAGLSAAEGKYIMILDSDDTISRKTIKNLITFFDKHYDEVDLVTYPMFYKTNKRKKIHYRYKMFEKGEGIYDLEENYYINQSNVNIIIKNKDKLTYFKSDIIFSEDEEFNTRILMEKKKIGFCSGAKYLYNRGNVNAATKTVANPLYSFEKSMEYYEALINEYKNEEGKVAKYVQVIFLNMIRWRIQKDQLIPYFKDDIELKKSLDRIKKLLQYVDIDTIINMPNMDKYHKFFVMELKGTSISTKIKENEFEIYADSILVENAKKITILINRIKCKKNKLEILACVRSAILLYKKFKLFCVTVNKDNKKERKEISTFESNLSKYKADMDVTRMRGFELELDISNIKKIYFEVEVEENIFSTNYDFGKFSSLNNIINKFTTEGRNFIYNGKEKIIEIKKSSIFRKFKFFIIQNLKLLLKEKKIKVIAFRLLTMIYRIPRINKNKKIWLYCDRKGIIDNAYYQFKNDIKNNDGIKRYYIVDNELDFYKDKFSAEEIKSNIVKKNSYRHKLLFFNSDKILTSFSSTNEYTPLRPGSVRWCRDMLHYDLIYIQHGILYANLTKMYGKEFTEIDKIVVSSKFEKENYVKNYLYNEKNLICTEMPRFDLESKEKAEKENKIIFAPSWRRYLIGDPPINGKRTLRVNDFLASKFYKEITKVFENEELKKCLEENKIILEFKLHPIFYPYKKYIKFNSDNIKLAERETDNEKYKLFITDFSSFQFDFARLKTPIIYFVPDKVEFDAGLHTYRKLDLELEEAFGPVIYEGEELVKKIKSFVENKFEIEEKYKDRMDNFFFNIDNRREKIYQILCND